jgi:HEAT repeat protein
MPASIPTICDPAAYRLEDAIDQARQCAQVSLLFELDLIKFLHTQCLSNCVDLPTVFRGLEVLGATLDETRLISLLGPFLRSTDPRIASKCVLILGRQAHDVGWIKKLKPDRDDRIRANLIEALWKRREPEAEQALRDAVRDKHPRVAANAVYGLYLAGSNGYTEALEQMLSNRDPAFRVSALWVVRSASESPERMRALIRDANADVRRAAFQTLAHLRDHIAEKTLALADPEALPQTMTAAAGHT